MVTGIKCPDPKCKSNRPNGTPRIWRKGRTPTRRGEKQRYVCFVCGRTFYLPGSKFTKPKRLRD